MKKVLGLVAVLALGLTIASCTKKAEQPAAPADQATAAPSEQAPAEQAPEKK